MGDPKVVKLHKCVEGSRKARVLQSPREYNLLMLYSAHAKHDAPEEVIYLKVYGVHWWWNAHVSNYVL